VHSPIFVLASVTRLNQETLSCYYNSDLLEKSSFGLELWQAIASAIPKLENTLKVPVSAAEWATRVHVLTTLPDLAWLCVRPCIMMEQLSQTLFVEAAFDPQLYLNALHSHTARNRASLVLPMR
jgi:hypothetical protein